MLELHVVSCFFLMPASFFFFFQGQCCILDLEFLNLQKEAIEMKDQTCP